MTIVEAYFAEGIRLILSMTFTGSILSLFLFMLKPVIQNRLPKSFQYCMWFSVLIAFLLPVSEIIVVPDWLQISDISIVSMKSFYDVTPLISDTAAAHEKPVNPVVIFFAFWLSGMLLVLGFHILCYVSYIRKLGRHNRSANQQEIEMLNGLTETNNALRLYKNAIIKTPILIGFFRPAVILPEKKYEDTQLQNILMHEITHWKRHDIFVKWLLIFTGAAHWFNPFAYLVRREMDRACELACDESVIKRFDISQMQQYGDTLIAVAADSVRKMPLPISMFEDKKILKERLGAIMEHKKYPKRAVIAASMVLFSVVCTVLGFSTLFAMKNKHIYIDNFSPQMQMRIKESEIGEILRDYDNKNIIDAHVSLNDLNDEITNAYIFIICHEKTLSSKTLREIKSLVSEKLELDISNIHVNYRDFETFPSGEEVSAMDKWK